MIERDVLILAAGKGTRLGLEISKPMVPICGRPLLAHTAENLAAINPDRTIVVVGHRADQIIRYFGNSFEYRFQQQLNGNAGALKVGLEGIGSRQSNILVIQGDDSAFYTPETYITLFTAHERRNSDVTALLTNRYCEGTHGGQFSVGYKGKILSYERPIFNPRGGCFFTGACCFKKPFLETYLPKLTPGPSGELIIPQLFQFAIQDSRAIHAIFVKEPEWFGINTPEELAMAQEIMRGRG